MVFNIIHDRQILSFDAYRAAQALHIQIMYDAKDNYTRLDRMQFAIKMYNEYLETCGVNIDLQRVIDIVCPTVPFSNRREENQNYNADVAHNVNEHILNILKRESR